MYRTTQKASKVVPMPSTRQLPFTGQGYIHVQEEQSTAAIAKRWDLAAIIPILVIAALTLGFVGGIALAYNQPSQQQLRQLQHNSKTLEQVRGLVCR